VCCSELQRAAECCSVLTNSMRVCVYVGCKYIGNKGHASVPVLCSASQCVAVRRSVLQCAAVCCSVLQCADKSVACGGVCGCRYTGSKALGSVPVLCSVLQCVGVAVCRSLLQCIIVC